MENASVNRPEVSRLRGVQECKDKYSDLERNELWRSIQVDVQKRLGSEVLNVWFERTVLRNIREEKLVVGVPNLIIQHYLEQRYAGSVAESAGRLLGRSINVKFDVDTELFQTYRAGQVKEEGKSQERLQLKIAPPPPEKAESPRAYLVGEFNRMVHGAARELAKGERDEFRFLGIYGRHGAGKSAFLHHVRESLVQRSPGMNVQMHTAESWANEFFYALQNNGMPKFRSRYRRCDAFLLDDVQFFDGKKTVQEELLHTVKALLASEKIVVLTSVASFDVFNKFLPGLYNLLRSCLGLSIGRLSDQDRTFVLKKLAGLRGVECTEKVFDLLGGIRLLTVRELENVLKTLSAYCAVHGLQRIDERAAEDALESVPACCKRKLTMEAIEKAVLKRFRITHEAVVGLSRQREVSWARHVAMYLAKQYTEASLVQVGNYFGGRTHSTVNYAIKHVAQVVADNTAAAHLIEDVIRLAEAN